MNREILFRGKRVDNGQWVEGYYSWQDIITVSYGMDMSCGCVDWDEVEVIPETVGQYTGLKDKNGKEIFENDIVKILYTDWASQSVEDTRTLEEYLYSIAKTAKVVWCEDGWELMFKGKGKYGYTVYGSLLTGEHGFIEVIGNITDNPESLEEV